MAWSLFDGNGHRKYLVQAERMAFAMATQHADGETRSFCLVLVFTGARISEVLNVTPEHLDEANGAIIFQTLKRRRLCFRAVPVPPALFTLLDQVHGFRVAQKGNETATQRIWKWSRTTAWKRVRSTMLAAGVSEAVAMPKALRHTFGTSAVNARIALSMIQKWLGHARIETTAIYTTPMGDEERSLAKLTWVPLLKALAQEQGQQSSRR